SIEGNYVCRAQQEERVISRQYLSPIGVSKARSPRVTSRNQRLQKIPSSGRRHAACSLNYLQTSTYEQSIPQATILTIERHWQALTILSGKQPRALEFHEG
ncbi:hypothetical protein NOI65_26070, partial [Escherichia coli]|nr:hypothetical protein [Escherichia coli]MDS0593447.1 hypothetical protein [Escherichia coli]